MDTAAFIKTAAMPLPEYKAQGTRYEHIGTGCDIFHVECDDEENVFAFIFPTPPSNSAGLPHIIEHSVLSGSERYPVKDPFAQLMQGSMNTFLNAMTYPDKTIYPAASLVENDFMNLLQVYGDAVFSPLLKEEIFLQEGHHLHVAENGSIVHSGVVYNEMKGNYSSSESIASEWTTRSLFSQSPYRFDSGGEPSEIAGLTYKDFLDFYKSHYHPGNSKIFIYGNIPGPKVLSLLDEEFLSNFGRGEPVPAVIPEPRWKSPKRMVVSAPASGKKGTGTDDMIFLNWLTVPLTDPLNLLSMEVLSEILFGNQGAPLYQRIVESGIGEDLSPQSGTDTNHLEILFTAGIRGVRIEQEKEFENLVFSTLQDLVRKGIPKQVIEGSLNRVEFRNREKRGGIPFGLRLLSRSLRGWLHGLPPEITMQFNTWFQELTKRYTEEENYFESLISKLLIENEHRSTVLIQADPAHSVRELKIDCNDQIVRKQAERETRLFNNFQRQQDSPDALARIPVLQRKDIPQKVDCISTEQQNLSRKQTVYTHTLGTNGIVYLDIAFPLEGLSREEHYFMPLFTKALYKIGCTDISYDELSRTLFEETGGFSSFLEASTTQEGTKCYVFFRLKTLETKFERGLSLIENIFTLPDLGNIGKIRDVLLEMKNDISSSLIPRGNQYAFLSAARHLQPALTIEEIWKGINQLFFLHHLCTLDETGMSRIEILFEYFLKRVLHAKDIKIQIAAEQSYLEKALTQVEKTIAGLPAAPATKATQDAPSYYDFIDCTRLPVGGVKPLRLAVPSSVGFAALAMRGSWFGTEGNAMETLLMHALKTGYLWEHVRMKGGAYGVSASANGTEGLISFTSYRDPHCFESLDTFVSALKYAASGKVSPASLEKSLIGTVGQEVKQLQPGAKSFVGFRRKLYGISDEARQQKRDYILKAKSKDIKQTAEGLLQHIPYGENVLIADEQTLRSPSVETADQLFHLPL